MANRKNGGDGSEAANQEKPTVGKRVAAKPATEKKTSASPKPAAAPKSAKAESPAVAKKATTARGATKSAADAATKAVKSVAKKISDAVSDMTSGRKTAAKTAEAKVAATKAKTEKTETPAAGTRSVKAADAAPKAAPKKATAPTTVRKSRTTVGALGSDVTSEDVNDALLDGESSGSFTPESDIADRNPVEVKEHFFAEHRQGPPMPETRELPQEYGDTKIVLLVRDPEWVFAYWELSDATRAEYQVPRNGHNRRMVIRLYNITGRNWPTEAAHYFQDVDVSPYAATWYFKLPEVSQKWCAEIGMYDEQNAYVPICRSNIIDTPRNSISEHTDSEWMVVEESFRKLYSMSGGLDVVAPGGGVTMRGGSEMIIRQLQRSVTGLLSAEGSGLSSGSLYSGNLVGGNGHTKKDFWLQVHTELILYGATEPNARVTVQGQPVRLNDDGTFSLRFSLPDGEQVLTVHATNADGDMSREITPIVTKTTT